MFDHTADQVPDMKQHGVNHSYSAKFRSTAAKITRITSRRLIWMSALVGILLLILVAFTYLPDSANGGIVFGDLRTVMPSLRDLVLHPTRWLAREAAARGAWLNRLETGDNYERIEYYCEAPKLILPADSEEELLAVQVLIRHGDRGSLRDVKESSSRFGCPYDETYAHPEVLRTYYDLAAAFKRDEIKHGFAFIPKKTGCDASQLTAKGILQHLQLGEAVKKRLGKGVTQLTSSGVEVHSTAYPRTFQSALTFLYGLDPSMKDPARHFRIAPENDTSFCTVAGTCRCTANTAFGKDYNRLRTDYYQQDLESVGLTDRLQEMLTNHVDGRGQMWTLQVFDVLLHFACHGKYLPCYDGKCTTHNELVRVFDILEKLADQLSDEPAVRRLSLVEGYGFLQKVVDNFSEKKLVLFSAHDSTIVPVIHSLGLPFKIVIPYASHVIFEIYSLKTSAERYIRIIYNGEDVTLETAFASRCDRSKNRCPYSSCKEFVEGDLKAEFQTACPV